MTQQEAQVITARLTRVWAPLSYHYEFGGPDFDQIAYRGQITTDVSFAYYPGMSGPDNYTFALSRDVPHGPGTRRAGCIFCDSLVSGIQAQVPRQLEMKPKRVLEYAQFAAQWTDIFRRNCWLLGCPIEASAHEKAEWMQGFSREEIEAWNLKM
ncbi:MAG: hypothetical protein EOO38_31690 [Cytophagaceae bacterium]|nr:MAG: hypothetical protein EOO38_31690 [Cytophagaceae bacterium]